MAPDAAHAPSAALDSDDSRMLGRSVRTPRRRQEAAIALVALSGRELVELARSPWELEELSAAGGHAGVVIDVADAPSDIQGLDALLATAPCVLIAATTPDLSPEARDLADLLDVAIDRNDTTALGVIESTITRCPVAAATLALLLRGGPRRTIADGLIAESSAYSLLQAGPEFAAWRTSRLNKERPAPDGPAVLVQRDDEVLHATLNRPDVHNAFSTEIRDGLVEALNLALADRTIERMVIDGNGPSFSSGGFLDEFGTFPDPAQAHVIRLTRSAGRLISAIAERVEVHLHGACMGAGIELPAFAGRVIADPATRIALPEVALGLVPGAGGTVSLPRRIGRRRTALLALMATPIDATTALDWGLIDEIRPRSATTRAT